MDKAFLLTAVGVAVPFVSGSLAAMAAAALKLSAVESILVVAAVDVVALYLAFKAVL